MRNATDFNAKAVVSTRGQVVIPREFREAFGIHSGTELVFKSHKGMLEVVPVKRSLDTFFGRCKRKGEKPMSLAEIDKAISAAVESDDESTK